MKKYNAMLDVAFTVVSEYEDWQDIPHDVLMYALWLRVKYLREHPEECKEAFGFCDQFEVEA